MKTIGQRPRRVIIRLCIAVSFVILLALVVFAPFTHHAWLHGVSIAVSATVSIVCGLLYLRSSRGAR